jgi:branched-chain amino acid transport system ATP-binding protein
MSQERQKADNFQSLLDVNDIEVIYNQSILALKQISLSVGNGEIVALLGANGAGKSTTLKSISQLIGAENGKILRGQIEYLGRQFWDRILASW